MIDFTGNILKFERLNNAIVLKRKLFCFYSAAICPNDADIMANSVDPDQTAPVGAVCSGTALFAQSCLSKFLGFFT